MMVKEGEMPTALKSTDTPRVSRAYKQELTQIFHELDMSDQRSKERWLKIEQTRNATRAKITEISSILDEVQDNLAAMPPMR